MPLQLEGPVIKEVQLVRSDDLFGNTTDPTVVTVRQGTMLDVERRAAATERRTTIYEQDDERVKVENTWNYASLQRLETFLTLASCNIRDENGDELFKFKRDKDGINRIAMSEDAFTRAWGKLPVTVAQEIHEAVLLANPTWGLLPAQEGE